MLNAADFPDDVVALMLIAAQARETAKDVATASKDEHIARKDERIERLPDMVYRLGKAPKLEPDRKSSVNRIPHSPTYNEGQAICLSPGMHRTEDDASKSR